MNVTICSRFYGLLWLFALILLFEAKNVSAQCEVFYFQDKTEFESLLTKSFVPFSVGIDTLAVVVHIVSQDSLAQGSNLSFSEVLGQIHATNLDLLRQNQDANRTPSLYLPLAASFDFVLGLATVDPNGQTLKEPGINRIRPSDFGLTSPPYSQSYVRNTIMAKTGWDRDRYINIWVCDLSSLLGFSSFPTLGLADLPGGIRAEQDGIAIDFQNFGLSHSNLKPAYSLGRTLSHELGHYFGLYHTFEGCDGDDHCNDTPQTPKANYACDPKMLACDGKKKSMFENFMDYSNDNCMNLFTNDQRNRVRVVLANSPRRKSLLQRSFRVITAVEENELPLFLKQNPVGLSLEFSQELSQTRVQIIDVNGFIKFDAMISGSSIDVSFLSYGIYLLRVGNVAFRFLKN